MLCESKSGLSPNPTPSVRNICPVQRAGLWLPGLGQWHESSVKSKYGELEKQFQLKRTNPAFKDTISCILINI